MRRLTSVWILACVAAGPAAAQGLGWLFGEPPPTHRRVRPRTARVPDDIPLPPPRPRFPDDPPLVAAEPGPGAAETPVEVGKAESTPPAPDAASAPKDVASAKDGPAATTNTPPTAPLPPAKPAELGGTAPPPAAPPRSEPVPAASATTAPAPVATASAPPAGPAPTAAPLPPEKPPSLGGSPSATPPASPVPAPAPAVAPSGATTAFNPRDPVADPQCADRLKARGVVAEPTEIGPQPDARCTVVQPMTLVSETLADGATVSFPDRPRIACVTADAFSAYVHDLVAPLAKGTWGVGLGAVWTGPGLECRSRDHVFGAKLSAHGQGLAVDIGQLKLADGRIVAVGEPKTDAERDFETAARAGGCGYFHTVLGPGSDSYHRTHWHFDLEVRGRDGDGKYCK